ncbi:TetR/AcrR family transcriptional regulator [Rhodococcus sp. NPDC003318]|uniref:TetR/AcrR family transcriptional regulator n=1 Tax=Rhodococcus sp. NPDC003318 TaxID=3364503 RepID=UPI0036C93F3F
MTVAADRRELIADTALDVIASDGIRALTHRAVDRRLDLPLGSTSYYFRTRRDLLTAAVTHLTACSRTRFDSMGSGPVVEPSAAARSIAHYLDRLIAERERDVRARLALATEFTHDDEMRTALASSLFSHTDALSLMRTLATDDPERNAAGLVMLCEGVVFDRTVGARTGPPPGTPASVATLSATIETFLRGAARL